MIYFVRAENGLIKIGYSAAPARRLAEMQTGSPVPLELIAVIPGSQKDERELHHRFGSARRQGEWFAPCAELLDFLRRLERPSPQPGRKGLSWRIEINTRKTKGGEIKHWVYRFGSGKNRQTVYGGMVEPWMLDQPSWPA